MCRPNPRSYRPEPHELTEYDLELLREARELIFKVYEYHYGDSKMRKEICRLETILNKIESLKNI